MAKARAKIDATKAVASLRRMAKAVPKAGGAALYDEGERARDIGVPLTPLDLGTLRGSWYVTKPRKTLGGGYEVEIGVGGAAAPYAIDQHENLMYSHEVGGPKFLERALLAIQPDFHANLVAKMRAAMKRMS